MPRVQTEQFGELDYEEEAVIVFPRGLPGFEQARRFVLLDNVEFAPLAHLQSLETGDLCFLTLPVRTVDPEYETMLAAEDRETLGWRDAGQPTLDLALLSADEDCCLSANLLAPIVIDLATRRGVQAVRCDTRYSHRHTLCGEPVCS